MLAAHGEGRAMSEMTTEGASAGYGRKVGERLRAIRRQKKLSLQEVEATSNQEFKASVLGAYERGERAISVPRLQRLARFYNVPVDQLLPVDEGPDFGIARDLEVVDLTDGSGATQPGFNSVTIDLTRLESLTGPEADMLNRYLTMIQVQRQDFNGRVLTIRRDDLRAIACILGTGVDGAGNRLDDLGLASIRSKK
jgi:transcriptional regulator with XRE-family HTH domain